MAKAGNEKRKPSGRVPTAKRGEAKREHVPYPVKLADVARLILEPDFNLDVLGGEPEDLPDYFDLDAVQVCLAESE